MGQTLPAALSLHAKAASSPGVSSGLGGRGRRCSTCAACQVSHSLRAQLSAAQSESTATQPEWRDNRDGQLAEASRKRLKGQGAVATLERATRRVCGEIGSNKTGGGVRPDNRWGVYKWGLAVKSRGTSSDTSRGAV